MLLLLLWHAVAAHDPDNWPPLMALTPDPVPANI
jgi:hypothetical protein